MPVSTCRTSTRFSLLSNWHHPFTPQPYPSLSYEDCYSWIQKGSIPTSGLICETTQFPQNTPTSQTQSGPSIPMDYYVTEDESMSQIPTIYNCMFSNTRMIIPLQVTMVKPRPSIKSTSTTIGPDSQSSLKTTANHVLCVPAPNPCATDHTDFSSNFRFPRSRGIQFPWT